MWLKCSTEIALLLADKSGQWSHLGTKREGLTSKQGDELTKITANISDVYNKKYHCVWGGDGKS